MGLGLGFSIGGRVRVSFLGSFRVRVRVGVRFWLRPGTRLDTRLFRDYTGFASFII